MNLNKLPADPVRLFRLAEASARGLAELNEGLSTDEALLRAAIAWAKIARDRHIAAVEGAKNSPNAARFLETARRRRIRAESHLRLRLTAVIARKCELLKDERLLNVAGFALSL